MATPDDTERQYQPSKWSKRFPTSEEVLNHHLKFIENCSLKVTRKIPCQLNIPYGPSDRQKYDILGTDLSDDSPILVFIHGGYWQETVIRRDSYHFIAENLHKNGIKTVFIGYDLCPSVTMPEIISQIKVVSKKVIEYSKRKKSKGLYFAGHSAGAHLVASLFFENYDWSTIKAAILISGVYNLSPLIKTTNNIPLKIDEKMALAMSPLSKEKLFGDKDTYFLFVVGSHESPEFFKQSKQLEEKLIKSGFNTGFSVVEKVDHYDIIESLYHEAFQLSKDIINVIKSK